VRAECIHEPTLRRLPLYHAIVAQEQEQGREFVSSSLIARQLELNPVQVRKDLETTGTTGTPRRGFPVAELRRRLESCLGWSVRTEAVLVGAGHLGASLMQYDRFDRFGLSISAGFDVDPRRVGVSIAGKPVLAMDCLESYVRERGIVLGILTVSPEAAQEATDRLVAAGIRGIWNFTPAKLRVAFPVMVERIELAASLAVLWKKLQARKAGMETDRLGGIEEQIVQFNR